MRKFNFVLFALMSLLLVNCAVEPEDPINCTVVQNEDGSATISCGDGTQATVGGTEMMGCDVVDNEDTTFTVTCHDGREFTFVEGTVTPDATRIVGNWTINNDMDLNAIQNIEEITGTLELLSSNITTISLPNLKKVGDVFIATTDVRDVDFSGLELITGEVFVSSDYLEYLNLDNLSSVGNNVRIIYNNVLNTVMLSSLTEVNGIFLVYDNPFVSHCAVLDWFEQVTCSEETQYNNDETETCQ